MKIKLTHDELNRINGIYAKFDAETAGLASIFNVFTALHHVFEVTEEQFELLISSVKKAASDNSLHTGFLDKLTK